MEPPRYESVEEMSRLQVEAAISRGDPEELLHAVLAAALYADDPGWGAEVCLRLCRHPHASVRGNAVLGFGHLARIHGALDVSAVLPAIEAALVDADPFVRSQALCAADDVEHFLGWRTSRPDPLRDWMEGSLPSGIRFALNDPVRVVDGEHRGALGCVVSVLDFEQDPLLLVELGDGSDVRVLQSALEPG
jgi:hypothetical protein